MRQILILTILHSQVCRGFVFSPSPIENSVEDISVEYDAESLNLVSQDFMEQKTKNEFDDKVLKRKFYCPIQANILDRKRECCRFISLFCCIEPVWE